MDSTDPHNLYASEKFYEDTHQDTRFIERPILKNRPIPLPKKLTNNFSRLEDPSQYVDLNKTNTTDNNFYDKMVVTQFLIYFVIIILIFVNIKFYIDNKIKECVENYLTKKNNMI